MGLRGSILHSQRKIGGAGFLNGGNKFNTKQIESSICLHYLITVLPSQSSPSGYRIRKAPMIFPISNGGLAARITNTFDAPDLIAYGLGFISGSATVVFTVTATGIILASVSGQANITFTTLCEIMGFGYIVGSADISAQPTAADIAGEFFAASVDGTYSMRDVLKILAAVAAGKTTINDLGGGNATVTFRDLSDTTDRVVADMTSSERTDVTLDL